LRTADAAFVVTPQQSPQSATQIGQPSQLVPQAAHATTQHGALFFAALTRVSEQHASVFEPVNPADTAVPSSQQMSPLSQQSSTRWQHGGTTAESELTFVPASGQPLWHLKRSVWVYSP
jgi:hypothetical protein